VPRLALTVAKAAEALSASRDFFDQHIRDELRVVRRGRKSLVPIQELEPWFEHNAALTVEIDRRCSRSRSTSETDRPTGPAYTENRAPSAALDKRLPISVVAFYEALVAGDMEDLVCD
jgi:hypothetical protein